MKHVQEPKFMRLQTRQDESNPHTCGACQAKGSMPSSTFHCVKAWTLRESHASCNPFPPNRWWNTTFTVGASLCFCQATRYASQKPFSVWKKGVCDDANKRGALLALATCDKCIFACNEMWMITLTHSSMHYKLMQQQNTILTLSHHCNLFSVEFLSRNCT